jgi:hypothetical protein
VKNVSILALLIFCKSLFSQTNASKTFHYGLGAEYYLSGNSHGGFYSGYFSLSRGKSAFTIGPVIHKRSLKMQGAKLGFSYKLVGLDPEDKSLNTGSVGLKLFSYIQYVDMLPLSYNAVLSENIVHNDYSTDWNKVKLSTGEIGLGMELHVRIAKAVTWRNFLGLSAFYHFNTVEGMYNERGGPVVFFGTGINIPRFKM